jgi:polygalacturonase
MKAAICVLLACAAAHAAGKTCDAKAMGAAADGKTKDTAALQKAIDTCAAAKDGGEVSLAAGTYLSGPLDLKSHVTLRLAKGATLLGSPDVEDYPIRTDAPWRRVSLIHADKAEDIGIVGEGTIDGQGQGWWTRQLNRVKGSKEAERPMLFDLTNSKRILIEGVTIQNSPQYNILAVLCDGLTVRNARIVNPGKLAPNTDGIDPVSTSHVVIDHVLIDTGDDNVAIKSGLVERNDPNIPSTDIVIRDCTFLHGHGLSIGSETAGGVRNVVVERVTFDGTTQGIRIKSARGRGNDIGNFTYKDITMDNVGTAIQVTMYYTGFKGDEVAEPVSEHTPKFHDILIENVTIKNARVGLLAMGLPESPIRGLVLRNVKISAERGMVARYAEIAEHGVSIVSTGDDAVKGKGAEGGAGNGPGVVITGK